MALGLTLSFLFFLSVATAVALAGYRYYVRPVRFQERLGEAVLPTPLGQHGTTDVGGRKWMVHVIQTVGEKVPISPQDATIARRYLIAAGYRSDAAIHIYYGAKVVMGVLFFLGSLVLRNYVQNPVGSYVVVAAGAALGYFGPNLILERIMDARMESLRFALPDALDLMVVCMEAGLGLDQAIANVSRELRSTHLAISEELSLVNLEMRAGKSRMESLKNLADRNPEPELRKLVATMIQADRFGTGISEALRTHSDFLRVRRRQDAEERAAKVGVKLVFPIFFFILPAMLVVAAGPGILQMIRIMIPLMGTVK
jgi:tight adherence protein C